MFLAYACRLTGFVETASFQGTMMPTALIPVLRKWCICWEAPEEISTDGGTNFTSGEMLAFYHRLGVRLRVSSDHFPQSNGRAEAAVRVAKRITMGPDAVNSDAVGKALL